MGATAAALALAGAGTAYAALTQEGGPYTVGVAPYSLNAADFNGDGLVDVATVNGTSSNVSVFLRQPGGGFAQEAGSPFAVNGPSTAAVGDYDGNGLPDLAVANFTGASVSVLLRQAGGGFALETGREVPAPGRLGGIATGDFNRDGRLDLAASLPDTGNVAVFLRNPQNTGFLQAATYAAGAGATGVLVADFNGDGNPDLAVADDAGNALTTLLNAGNGTFASEGSIGIGGRAAGLASADFNHDGRPDVAVNNYTTGTVSIFLRQPGGGFGQEGSPIPVTTGPVGITAADLDGDGWTDLAIAANGGAIEILRRNPAGGFTRDPAIAAAGTPNGITAADFDRDGRQDLAFSDSTGNTFSVLLNPAPAGPPPGPGPTPTPTPLPTPVAGKTVNVAPVSGKVKIKRPGGKTFVTLTAGAQIPVGSTIDTRDGRVKVTAAQGKGKTASADFYDGLFKLTQTGGSKPVATLTLTEQLSCPRGRASAAAKKPKSRKLWGDGGGSFRTRGQYSAATVRGTRWLTQDTCTATLTRVAKGVVSVRDLVKRKTVIVRAGKRYTARAKKH